MFYPAELEDDLTITTGFRGIPSNGAIVCSENALSLGRQVRWDGPYKNMVPVQTFSC